MEETTLHDRLRGAAGDRTYRQLAKLTTTHAESVRRYMQGQSPSVEFLTNFCEALEINGSWLLTGEGPMHGHEIRPHALRTSDAPDLLRALSDTVSVLLRRVDRLERLVQTTEIKLRAADGVGPNPTRGIDGHDEERVAGSGGARVAADRIGAAVPERAPGDAD